MNAEHPAYAEWDAAYVLGALSAAERREFEAHLDDCPECRAAVAELGPTVGLLSRLTAADVAELDAMPSGPAGPAADGGANLVAAAARRRARRRGRWLVLAAAVVLVVAAIAVPVTIGANSRPTAAFALEDVAGIPLEASVRLTDVKWGTRLELDCRYPDVQVGEVPEGGWTYALAVVGADGTSSSVSTWRAGPGTSARLSAGTALSTSDIRAIEILSASGKVLMRYELGGAPTAGG